MFIGNLLTLLSKARYKKNNTVTMAKNNRSTYGKNTTTITTNVIMIHSVYY